MSEHAGVHFKQFSIRPEFESRLYVDVKMFVHPIMSFYWLFLSCEMFYKSDYLYLIFYVESTKKPGVFSFS